MQNLHQLTVGGERSHTGAQPRQDLRRELHRFPKPAPRIHLPHSRVALAGNVSFENRGGEPELSYDVIDRGDSWNTSGSSPALLRPLDPGPAQGDRPVDGSPPGTRFLTPRSPDDPGASLSDGP